MNQPFHGIRQLHIEAPVCHSGDHSFKNFTDMILHIFRLLHLHSLPLRFLGSPQGTTAVVLGSVLYKLCIQVAMSMGLPTNMMKLITATLFLLVLVLSGRKGEAIIHA